MHELGILNHAVRTVNRIAEENKIQRIDYVTLEVGEASGYVPVFLEKLYPVAIEKSQVLKDSELKIVMAEGKGLSIKDIGYRK